jgi:hypothetical protein
MAVNERSTPGVSPQVVPATDAGTRAVSYSRVGTPNGQDLKVDEILRLVDESLRPLAPIAGALITSAFACRSKTQTGTVRKDFLEGLVIALLSFAIGLAVAAALCMGRR